MKPKRQRVWVASLWIVAGLASVLVSLAVGSVSIGPAQWWAWLSGSGASDLTETIVQLRLPRVWVAFACGGLLALSGALLQAVLRNALAEPAVLGVSSGAGLGAILALSWGGVWAVEWGAGLGASAAMAVLFAMYRKMAGGEAAYDGQAPARLILAGVMLSSSFAAATALVLSLTPDGQLKGMLFWMMGDLSGASTSWLLTVVWCLVGLAAFALAPDLNVMVRGEALAQSLGVAVERRRFQVLALAVAATATSVTVAGAIGFVGLVVPHVLRTRWGNDQRFLLPAAWVAGGMCLSLADTVARTVIAPMELPVGVVTALIGAPVFVVLLIKARHV